MTPQNKFKRAAAPESAPQGSPITPKFALTVFTRWWKLNVPLGLLIAAVGIAVVVVRFEPQYEAAAVISITKPPHIAFRNADESSWSFVATQLQLLRMSMVLAPVLEDAVIANLPELREVNDPVSRLMQNISVAQIGASELYRIGFVSRSAEGAAAVCNRVVQEYMGQHVGYERERQSALLKTLTREKERAEIELEKKRALLLKLTKERTGVDPWNGQITDEDMALNATPLNQLYSEMTQIELQRVLISAQIESRKMADLKSVDSDEDADLVDLVVAGSPAIMRKMESIKRIENDIEVLDYHAGAEHPRMKLLADSLRRERAELERLEETTELETLAKQDLGRRRELAARLEGELDSLNLRDKELSEKFSSEVKNLQDGSDKAVRYLFAQGELKRAQSVFDLIAERELALLVEQNRPERVRLRQAAQTPVQPIGQWPYKPIFVCAMGAFALPYGLFFLYEFCRKKIYDADQLRQELRIPLVGEVARLPRTVARTSSSGGQTLEVTGMGLYSESIDILQTNLLLSDGFVEHGVLGITSSVSGEGKTSIAVQLSRSVARATGKPTLLIDADLRAPDVANYLVLEHEPGLTDVLAGDCQLDDAIQKTGFHSLAVLAAGRQRRNASDLLRGGRFGDILAKVRNDYSFVIVDTPPVLGASETLLIGSLCDTVLFCCMRDISVSSQVRNAVERLERAGAHVVGSMLNGTAPTAYAYKYGRYYDSRESELVGTPGGDE